MKKFIRFAAQSWVLFASFVLTVILALVVFPLLPIGGALIDLQPGYSLAEIGELMTLYGESGRRNYALASATLDTLFPLCYVTLFAGLMYRFRPVPSWWWLCSIPIVLGIVDLLENVQIITMLVQFPNVTERQVEFASRFTLAKQSLTNVVYILVVLMLLLGVVDRLVKRFRQ